MYDRRLWTVFLDTLIKDAGRLPAPLHENLKTVGAFVVCETFSLMSQPKLKHLESHQDQLPDCCRAGRSPLAAATGKPLPRDVFGQSIFASPPLQCDLRGCGYSSTAGGRANASVAN
jgi:Flagellar protein FlaF